MFPTLADIRQAAERIRPYAHQTPVMTSESLNQQLGVQVFLKCENFQKVGAFKFRGACNAVFSLSETDAACGVVAHSSGNHAARRWHWRHGCAAFRPTLSCPAMRRP
ncbi:MAG: pyridoxal-phosphate dependent enzyme [Caldilineaceae bacterium]